MLQLPVLRNPACSGRCAAPAPGPPPVTASLGEDGERVLDPTADEEAKTPLGADLRPNRKRSSTTFLLEVYPEAAHLCDGKGRTPLHLASKTCAPLGLVEMLLRHSKTGRRKNPRTGAVSWESNVLDLKDASGNTPVSYGKVLSKHGEARPMARLAPSKLDASRRLSLEPTANRVPGIIQEVVQLMPLRRTDGRDVLGYVVIEDGIHILHMSGLTLSPGDMYPAAVPEAVQRLCLPGTDGRDVLGYVVIEDGIHILHMSDLTLSLGDMYPAAVPEAVQGLCLLRTGVCDVLGRGYVVMNNGIHLLHRVERDVRI